MTLSTKEAARLLSVSVQRVQELCRTGKLEFDYSGRSFRIPKRAVEDRKKRLSK